MTEKIKNEAAQKPILNRLSFFLLWVLVLTGSTVAASTLIQWLIDVVVPIFGISSVNITSPIWRFALLSSLLYTARMSFLQSILMRLAFGRWIKGWIWASILGGILGILPTIIAYQLGIFDAFIYQAEPQTSLFWILGNILATAPQAWILRRYVQKPWLYMLIAVPSWYLVSKLSLYDYEYNIMLGPLAHAMYIGVTALLMLWFFRDTTSQEKAKVMEAQSHGRLEDSLEDDDSEDDVGIDAIDYEMEETQ